MKNLLLAVSALVLATPALAEDGKVCAAIKSCDVSQVVKVGRKKSTFKRTLTFDELCGADNHSLPLELGMELELAIVKETVVAKLTKAGKTLSTKSADLDAKKMKLKYRGQEKDAAIVDISCKP